MAEQTLLERQCSVLVYADFRPTPVEQVIAAFIRTLQFRFRDPFTKLLCLP